MKHTRRILELFARDALVSALVAGIALGPAAAPAFANPRGADVRRGDVTIDNSVTGTMVIHASDGSIIHYESFNIARGEVVQFVQTKGGVNSSDARVLNRILGDSPTQIDGALRANGQVYIVNPAGVYFGAGSEVNVNGLHAAAGRISDEDFIDGTDHFTGVKGKVTNAGRIAGCNELVGDACANTDTIAARAVSLVGAQVVNEAGGRILAQQGWIVIAAGNDVLIGRDDNGRGLLLRVEGAADAVFDRNAVGVLNNGVLDAGVGASGGSVRIGAGDLYGTAIFSDSAIQARQIALDAGNRGNVALGGTVRTQDLDVTLRGSRPGELRGANADGSTTTVRADSLKLTALGNGPDAKVNVGEGLAFRSQASDTTGPATVAISQTAELKTSGLANLDVAPGAGTTMTLTSTGGNVVVDDRAHVTNTNLGLTGALADIQGTDTLNVQSLTVKGNAKSAADVVAASGGISVSQDLALVTQTDGSGTLLSAHNGGLRVDGDIATSNGGAVRIEAASVNVGKTEGGVSSGGAIRTTGTTQGAVSIGFTDSTGAQQTQTVNVRTIDTRGAAGVAGGNVDVHATGNVDISTIATGGGANSDTTRPNFDGGNVTVSAGDGATNTLRVDNVSTGGAEADGAGEIKLSGHTVVVGSAIDASGGTVRNPAGRRDRDVTVNGAISLAGTAVSVLGGDVTLNGPITESTPTGAAQLKTDLGISSAGVLRMGSADVQSLAISSTGSAVVFTGDVNVDKSLELAFDTAGTGTVSGEKAGGGDVNVTGKRVVLAAIEVDDPEGRSAAVELGDGLHFNLSATTGDKPAPATMILSQDRTITGAEVAKLRDATSVTDASRLKLEVRTNDVLSLDAAGRAATDGTDLLMTARRFEALDPSGTPTDFNVGSFDLSTKQALDMNFGVTATDGVSVHAGTSGIGDLLVRSTIDAKTLKLIAGDGTSAVSSTAHVDARVIVDPAARLRGTRTESVDLIQDASFDSADLPDTVVFGPSGVANLGYGIESRDGAVTLSSGSEAKFAGSKLRIFGQTGVDLGSDELFLASLDASTTEALGVHSRINTTDGGTIKLHSGTDGSGDLTVTSRLAADHIELLAGSGDSVASTARVQIGPDARFSASTGDAHPLSFVLEQDAGIGPGTGTRSDVPGLDLFGGDITGMSYALRSRGSSVVIDHSALVNHTDLELRGQTGVSVAEDLDVAGFKSTAVTGGTTLSGDVVSSGGIDLVGAVTLNGAGDQLLQAGTGESGVLKAVGAITKTSDGSIAASGRAVELATVTTAHRGGAITITGTDSVKTGALDASGAVLSNGGAVTVHATNGTVDVASIDAHGSNGSANTASPSAGLNGGAVDVSGTTVAIGNVNAAGGNATSLAEGGVDRAAKGGDAGKVDIFSSSNEITLRGSVNALGGAGDSSDPTNLPPQDGNAADVTLTGNVVLDAKSTALRGDHVQVTGGVAPISTRVPTTGSGTTELIAEGERGVSFGGDLTATKVDIQVNHGDLALASGGVHLISADSVRLAATDGAGGNDSGQVILDGLAFANEPRSGTANSTIAFKFTLEQDNSIGTGGSALPADSLFAGVDSLLRGLELISYDGAITLDTPEQVASVNGTDLLLAANDGIQVIGSGLNVTSLALGARGVDGQVVGGNASIGGDVVVAKGFRSFGENVDVAGDMSVGGTMTFARDGNQTLHLDPGHALTINGSTVSKATDGFLHLDSDRINLSSTALQQTIENLGGQLVVGSAAADGLVKGVFAPDGTPVPQVGTSSLTLRGTAAAGGGPAVIVNGTRNTPGVGETSVLVADGDLTIDAVVAPDASGDVTGTGTWSVGGDILAYGDVDLRGSGVLAAGRDSYSIEARRQTVSTRTDRGGELRIGGLSSADADVRLKGAGALPPADGSNPHPGAVFTQGSFTVDHGLTVVGTTQTVGATTIKAGGDVSFESRIQGNQDLTIQSQRTLTLRDDVAMTGGRFSGAANQGILFASTSDLQTIQAGSISLGDGAAKPAKGSPSMFRNGDLTLDATSGGVSMGSGQRLQVAGELDVAAAGTASLANVAALDVNVKAGSIALQGGSTVAANQINLSSRPDVRGGGSAFLATPTGTEVSNNAAADNVVLRQINDNGTGFTQASLASGVYPTVDGPARIDVALDTPQRLRPATIVRPRADRQRLALAKDSRPLWADELLVYLEQRSLVAPSAREQEALPPVSAGPSDASAEIGGVPLGEEALQVLPPYRALFRPDTEVDPDTGLILGENRVAPIRASFAQAAAAGGDLNAAIAASPEASANLDKLAALFAASGRALDAQQQARFRQIVCARVAPKGVSAAQLDALIP